MRKHTCLLHGRQALAHYLCWTLVSTANALRPIVTATQHPRIPRSILSATNINPSSHPHVRNHTDQRMTDCISHLLLKPVGLNFARHKTPTRCAGKDNQHGNQQFTFPLATLISSWKMASQNILKQNFNFLILVIEMPLLNERTAIIYQLES